MMRKLITNNFFIVLIVIAICVIIIAIIRSFLFEETIHASVSPTDVELGGSISLVDNTNQATSWLWEMGNGDTITSSHAVYTFPYPGKYQIRLRVNGSLFTKFLVNVRPGVSNEKQEQLIKINAVDTVMQGEYIIFRGEGDSKEWRWEFGESGMIDSREKSAIYTYSQPGVYEVLLSTEDTKYPVRHMIEVLPNYSDNDSIDVLGAIGEDIRKRLQGMVDGAPFNENYYYILDNYLCSDADAVVIINDKLRNDFYSYCQGLKIMGYKKTMIERVSVNINPDVDECINKLIVTQYELEE